MPKPKKNILEKEFASAKKDWGLFSKYQKSIANPDPILKKTKQGIEKGIDLFSEMKRDAHISAALQSRKRSVLKYDFIISSASDKEVDIANAEFLQEGLKKIYYNLAGYILDAIKKAKRIGHLHHLSACYVHLTELYIQMEEYQTALEYGELAREDIKKMGGSEALVTIQVHAGLAYLGLGDVEAARRSGRMALSAIKQMNQDGNSVVGLDDQANIFQLLGKIAKTKGQLTRARSYYQRGYTMLYKANRPLPAARTLLTLVELLIEEQNRVEAEKQLGIAVGLFKEHNATSKFSKIDELHQQINAL